jgi:dTDP-4-amino-4,6-dideoxygalactose transaminase
MNPVTEFENKIAEFFGAKYAVAVDSATHGLELCLRLFGANHINCPHRTYLSVPMLADKLGIELRWRDKEWSKFYEIYPLIIDAAVLWEKDSYCTGTFRCISFQYQKHLSLGRGGMILCPDTESAYALKLMSYDGRIPGIPWREQNIKTMGYHYYMTPETAAQGLAKLPEAIATEPRIWTVEDWVDLTTMDIFKI